MCSNIKVNGKQVVTQDNDRMMMMNDFVLAEFFYRENEWEEVFHVICKEAWDRMG